MNKTLTGAIVAVIIVGGVSFYAGSVYGKSQVPAASARGQFGGPGGIAGARTGARGAGGFTTGQILSKDATSMTVQMSDGSTKIVLFSTSTQVMKTATGSVNDLSTGTDVVVTGTSNSDGSVTAQSVQVRPAGALGGAGQRQQQPIQ